MWGGVSLSPSGEVWGGGCAPSPEKFLPLSARNGAIWCIFTSLIWPLFALQYSIASVRSFTVFHATEPIYTCVILCSKRCITVSP